MSAAIIRPRSAGWLLGIAFAVAGPAARADQIDRALTHNAGAVADAVRGLGAKSVAALKFQVRFGSDAPTFKAGTIGTDMVHRLENILFITADASSPLVLIGAGEEAAKAAKPGTALDWTTPDGRARLFGLKLEPLWGESAERASPDAFVTGTVRVSADLKDITIELVGFTKADPSALRPLMTLDGRGADAKPKPIRTDRGILTGLGQTFTVPAKLPAARSRAFAADDAAVADAAKRNGIGTPAPGGPVKLDVYYDDVLVAPEPDPSSPGEFRVPTPKPGQKVRFDLTNAGPDKVAVLLAVNGRNTIATEGEDLGTPGVAREKFRTWVLEPDPAKKYNVTGFLMSMDGSTRPFTGMAEDASARTYDALSPTYAGKIHMIVFGKRPKAPAPPPVAAADPPPADPVAVENIPVETTPADPAPVAKPTPPEPEEPKPNTVPVEQPQPEPKVEPKEKPAGPVMLDAAGDDLKELNDGIDAGGLVTVSYAVGKSRDLAAAQAMLSKKLQLAKQADGRLASTKPKTSKSKGLIGGGDATSVGNVDQVKFDYDPLPIGSVVIGYYAKKPTP